VLFGGLQGADLVFPALGLAPHAFNAVVLAGLLGFPLAVALAWMFDVTPQGIRRTAPVDPGERVDPRGDRWARLKAALVGAGFMAVVWYGVHVMQRPVAEGGAEIPTQRPVLAVLPFQDLSPGQDQAYLADGLHEELLHQLAVIRGVELRSRTSVMHFRGSPSAVGAIADSLGARYILEGSVREAGDSIRVTVQLIDAATDEHLWSESYNRALSLEGLFNLEGALASRVAGSLVGTLATAQRQRLGRIPTTSLEAYNLYLRGLYHLHQFSPDGVAAADEDLARAIALDPDFGRAWASRALANVILNNLGVRPSSETFPVVREGAERAMALAPDEPETHMAMSAVRWTLEWDWAAAREHLEAALRLDPDFVDAHLALAEWHGVVAGETDLGMREVNIVLRIDPFSPWVAAMEGYVPYVGRRYEDAERAYRRRLEIAPDDALMGFNLALALVGMGRRDDALRVMDGFLEGVPVPLRGPVVQVYAEAGRMDQARAVLAEMRAMRDGGGPVGALNIAMGYATVGEVDEAFEWLERCFRDEGGTYFLRDPIFDPLRGDPRFQVYWDEVGLPGELPPPPSPG